MYLRGALHLRNGLREVQPVALAYHKQRRGGIDLTG